MKFDEMLEAIHSCGNGCEFDSDFVKKLKSARNAHGDSLLHILAAEGDEDAVTILLKIGCDVNSKNNFGSTAIACAAWREEYLVVRNLIDAGADITIPDSTGFTVIETLKMMGKNEMVELILSRVQKL